MGFALRATPAPAETVIAPPDAASHPSRLRPGIGTLVRAAARGGLHPDERHTYSSGGRKAVYRDPDGNELGFGGLPVSD